MKILIVVMISAVFTLIRNEWVYSQRIRLLRKDSDEWKRKRKADFKAPFYPNYDSLPSYETMLLKFWVWNINKFIKKP